MQEHKKLRRESHSNSKDDLRRWNLIACEYDTHIARGDFFREQMLNPVMYELLNDVSGLHILDAGCGQGYLSHELSVRGAIVSGVDGAESLIAIAQSRYQESDTLRFVVNDLTEPLSYTANSFDVAVANMVFMDIDPLPPVLHELHRTIKHGGVLLFSILHPLFDEAKLRKGFREHLMGKLPFYAISRYATPQQKPWHIPGTSHATRVYHRSIEYYSRILKESGYIITDIREPVLKKEITQGNNNALRILTEIPMFLIIRATTIPTHNN